MRLLLIEDNPADARLIREMLAESSAETPEFSHAPRLSSALQRLRQETFEVVLLDLGLPDSQGLETLIQTQQIGSATPIVVLTGLDDGRFALEAVRAGAQDYLVKGQFDSQLLIRTLRYAIERKRAEVEIRRLNSELEQRVIERTAELRETNVELSKEVAEHRHAELALARAERDWERTFESMPDPIAVLDNEHRLVRMNRAMAERLSANPEAGCKQTCFSCVHGRSEPPPECPHVLTIRDGREHSAELYEPRMGGSFLVTTTPLLDENGKIEGAVHVAHDITERKRHEKALQESEERLRMQMDRMPIGCIVFDRNNCFSQLNPAAEHILGYAEMELRGQHANVIVPETNRPHVEDIMRRLAEGDMTAHSENENLTKNGAIIFCQWTNTPLRDAADNFIGFLSMVQDITERKKAEDERAATAQFLAAINLTAGLPALLAAATDFFRDLSGCEAVGIRLQEGEDFPYFETRGFPAEFVRLESSLCVREIDGRPQCDAAGNPAIACMCGNVICGRFDPTKPFFSPKGSFWTNDTTQLLATTTGADRQANTRNRCNGEGYESVALIRLLAGEERLGLLQLNDKRRGRFSPEKIAFYERLAGYLAIAIAKVRTEEALRKSEEQFRHLANAIPQLCWMANADGWIFWYNDRWYDYTGTTPQQMEGWGWQSVHDSEALPGVLERWRRSIATGQPFDMVFPLRGADGVFRPFLTRVVPIKDADGKVVRWFGTNTDVSEQQADFDAMTRLQKLGAMFVREGDWDAVLGEIVEAAIAVAGADFGSVQLLDPETGGLRIVAHRGFPQWWVDFWKSVPEGAGSCGTARQRGERVIVEDVEHSPIFAGTAGLEIQLKAGVRACQSTPLLSRSGKLLGIFSTHYGRPHRPAERALRLLDLLARQAADMIDRIQAEEALKQSLERLERVLEVETVGVMFWDLTTGRLVDANDTFLKMMGYDRSDVEGRELTWQKFTPPEYHELSRREVEKFMATGRVGPYEKEYFRKDGTRQWLLFAGSSLGNNQCVEFCIDISGRKQAEARIDYLATFPELNPSFIFEADSGGRVTYVNPSARRRFPALEADGFEHPLLRDWPAAAASVAAGGAQSVTREVETDGSVFLQTLYSPQAGVVRAYCLDITERKRAAAALVESERVALQREQLRALAGRLEKVREEERTLVARDLHDDIGQILTAVKMDLHWIGRHAINKESEAHRRLESAVELIGHGMRSVRAICTGLRPSLLDDLGLAAAIEWQADEFSRRTGIANRLSLPEAKFGLSRDQATVFFRIFQECLTNVSRHAHARAVDVSLHRQGEDIVLVVRDDGKGFREESHTPSLGILGMKERAQSCGGELSIASSAGEGTAVTLRVPLHADGSKDDADSNDSADSNESKDQP